MRLLVLQIEHTWVAKTLVRMNCTAGAIVYLHALDAVFWHLKYAYLDLETAVIIASTI